MNRKIFCIFTACLTALSGVNLSASAPINEKEENVQKDDFDIILISEAFGHFIGKNLKSGADFDKDAVIRGINKGAANEPAPMSDKDYQAAMVKLQQRAFEKVSSDNLKAANEFLEKNAKNEGIIEIEPGKLQYLVLSKGQGEKVESHSKPTIHYTGKYLDGTTFGSSRDANGPIAISLDQTIPGFTKGLVGMTEGEKRRLFIHPDLGYGTLGQLPPNALLIFDIEVIKADSPDEGGTTNADEEDEDDEDTLAMEDDDDDSDDFSSGSLRR